MWGTLLREGWGGCVKGGGNQVQGKTEFGGRRYRLPPSVKVARSPDPQLQRPVAAARGIALVVVPAGRRVRGSSGLVTPEEAVARGELGSWGVSTNMPFQRRKSQRSSSMMMSLAVPCFSPPWGGQQGPFHGHLRQLYLVRVVVEWLRARHRGRTGCLGDRLVDRLAREDRGAAAAMDGRRRHVTQHDARSRPSAVHLQGDGGGNQRPIESRPSRGPRRWRSSRRPWAAP